MTMTTKIWDFLGSRNLSVYIFITGLTYFLFLVIFGAFVPALWVGNISRLLPFKVLYILFFINLIICEIKWIPAVIRRCRRPEPPETLEEMERFRHKITVQGSEFKAQSMERYLRRRGYRIQTKDFRSKTSDLSASSVSSLQSPVFGLQSILCAYRGRFSPIGNLLFHVSFLFILAGALFSMISHFEKKVLLMEGQKAEEGFEVVEIKPEFWKNKLLFTDLRANINYDDGEEVIRMSKAASIGGKKMTIQGVSYTPKYVLRDLSGRTVDVGYVNLVNFVPGSVDHFTIPGFPYKIYVSVYPDHEIREGKISTRSMNLSNPACLVRVVRGKTLLYSGILGPRDEAFFDGFRLSFPEIKYNGTFRIIIDKGEPLIWAGFILMGAGLIWKLLFYRREVAVCVFGDKIYVCLNSDYYPNLFLNRCKAMVGAG